MKNFILNILLVVLLTCISCTEEIDSPSATFTIEVDIIIDNVLTRREVNTVRTGQMVYFVKQNDSWFNSVWPGDSTSSGEYHDYGTCDEGMVFRELVFEEGDTSYMMDEEPCQGISLSNGTEELSYVYEFPGIYTVTWVATNSGIDKTKTTTSTKVITVE